MRQQRVFQTQTNQAVSLQVSWLVHSVIPHQILLLEFPFPLNSSQKLANGPLGYTAR